MLFANMGVPIVCVAVPVMLIALLPITGIESLVYYKRLGRPFKDAFWGALFSNLWSTLVGVPLMWLPLVIVQLSIGGGRAWGMDTTQQRVEAVTLQAAWLIPYSEHLAWMIPAASIVLLLPFYLGSVVVEYLALAVRWKSLERKRLFAGVALANALSYTGLGVYYGSQLWFALSFGQ
jgi:hypothetical protein